MADTDKLNEMNSEAQVIAKKEIVRKIYADPEDINKMKRISSLYADEIPEGAKEIDVISFFYNKAFKKFLVSGEIEKKVEEIKNI